MRERNDQNCGCRTACVRERERERVGVGEGRGCWWCSRGEGTGTRNQKEQRVRGSAEKVPDTVRRENSPPVSANRADSRRMGHRPDERRSGPDLVLLHSSRAHGLLSSHGDNYYKSALTLGTTYS